MRPWFSNSAYPCTPELRTYRHRKCFLCEKPTSNAKRRVGCRLATNNRDPEFQMGRSTIRAARQVAGARRRRKMISQRKGTWIQVTRSRLGVGWFQYIEPPWQKLFSQRKTGRTPNMTEPCSYNCSPGPTRGMSPTKPGRTVTMFFSEKR